MKRFARFCTVGLTGVLVNAGLFHILIVFAGMDYRIASVLAIETAILNNFSWNYLWTFGDRKMPGFRFTAYSLLRFNMSSGFTAMAVNWGILVFLKEIAGQDEEIANFTGILAGTAFNYILSHKWAFKKQVHR